MAKVLISFLGVANQDRENYRLASYKFPDNDTIYESSFIAEAIRKRFGINKMILIGTAHSMWENVFQTYANQTPEKKQIVEKIWEQCLDANHDSQPTVPHIEELEDAIGGGSKVLIINYGLNEDETQNNMMKILEIENFLNRGDELYVDITHSFRSIPMYIMNILIYLQDVSRKDIKIEKILYGMLDVSNEFNGISQVVYLNNLLDINNWIVAANSFLESGNAYQIADLLEKNGDKSNAITLRDFSNAIQLNNLNRIEKMVNSISKLSKAENYKTPLAAKILPGVMSHLYNQLRGATKFQIQYRLAKWHAKHFRYGLAYLDLVEAIISYVQECVTDYSKNHKGTELAKNYNKEESEFAKRNFIKNEFFNDKSAHNRKYAICTNIINWEVIKLYKQINPIRNRIAHQDRDATYENSNDLIRKLEECIKALEIIFKK